MDVIHAHQYTPFFYAALTGLLRRRPPILFTEHGRFFPDVRRRRHVLFNRLMLRRGDRVVGVGEAVRRALVENEGFPPSRVGVVYNGVDLDRLQAPTEGRARVRRTIGLTDDDFVVIQVARLDELKDHATALRAMERLAVDVPGARLLIVGDGPLRGVIEDEIASRSLQHCVKLLGTRRDVPELLAAADAALLTSISEGIPLTLIEAMAAGLPIVATRVGGVPEVVVDGETGWLAAAGDDEGLAAALTRLAADADQRGELGDRGRRRARQSFSDTQMCRAYADLYDEMLNR